MIVIYVLLQVTIYFHNFRRILSNTLILKTLKDKRICFLLKTAKSKDEIQKINAENWNNPLKFIKTIIELVKGKTSGMELIHT